MSYSLRNIIVSIMKKTLEQLENKNYNTNDKNISYKLNVLSGLVTLHGCYIFSSLRHDEIYVIKKYEIMRNGFNEFMIIDNKNRHLNINNSFWFWKWDTIEDWHNINKNDNLSIYYYGYRIPFLGLFPVIIFSNKSALNLVNNYDNFNNDYKKLFEITNWLVI